MPDCKNCIHNAVCDMASRFVEAFVDSNGICTDYKDKSLIVELPCKVGDKLYIVGTECLADKDSQKCEELTAENPYLCCEDCPLDKRLIVFERTATKEMVSVLLLGDNENFIFGETVYLTREEAEKKLKERE